MACIVEFSSKNIVSQKVYRETVNQPGHFILSPNSKNTVRMLVEKSIKIKCPGCFTVSRYTFWDPIFFDEKSIIQAILRYMGHPKWTKSQI